MNFTSLTNSLNDKNLLEYFSNNLILRDPFSNSKIENYKYSQLNKINYNKDLKRVIDLNLDIKDNFLKTFDLIKKTISQNYKITSWKFNGPDSAIRLASLLKDPNVYSLDLDQFNDSLCVIDLSKYKELNIEFNYSKSEKLSLIIIDTDSNISSDPRYLSFNISKNASIELLNLSVNKPTSLIFYEFNLEDFSKVKVVAIQANNNHLRNEFYFYLNENCHAEISGTNFSNNGVNDNYSFIQHSKPNSSSREVFKSIVDQGAITNFQGKIYVDRIAQKTDGYQMSRSLLLDSLSRSNNKPELEIYADDVKCSHGSTISKIDEDQLYYFKSRGIDTLSATNILKRAFIQEVLDSLETSALRVASDKVVSRFMS